MVCMFPSLITPCSSLSIDGPSLLLFSALGLPPFKTIKIRSRRSDCPACGMNIEKNGKIEETDYVAFCGGDAPDWEKRGLVGGEARLTAQVYTIVTR